MKKIIPFIIFLCVPFLLTSCYPDNSWLWKPVKKTVSTMLDRFNSYIYWNEPLLSIDDPETGKSTLTEEWKSREKITTDFIKSLRKDYISKKLTCEQKQLNLETNYKAYFQTAKQRNWLHPNYTTENEYYLRKLSEEISYPCSNFQKEKVRHDIRMRLTWYCINRKTWESVLCEDTRKILEKYDKEFLELINKYWVDNLEENTPKWLILRSL